LVKNPAHVYFAGELKTDYRKMKHCFRHCCTLFRSCFTVETFKRIFPENTLQFNKTYEQTILEIADQIAE